MKITEKFSRNETVYCPVHNKEQMVAIVYNDISTLSSDKRVYEKSMYSCPVGIETNETCNNCPAFKQAKEKIEL